MSTPFPRIPAGLLTKLGTAAAAAAALFAGVAAVLDGDHSEETLAGIASAAVLLYGVIRARGDQAAAVAAATIGTNRDVVAVDQNPRTP